jgi:hypothetical protein
MEARWSRDGAVMEAETAAGGRRRSLKKALSVNSSSTVSAFALAFRG